MGCGCDGLSGVRQGGRYLLTWITWICRRSEGQACMGRIYMAMHYRVDSQLVQYNGDEALKAIPSATASKLRYIPPRCRLGCHN